MTTAVTLTPTQRWLVLALSVAALRKADSPSALFLVGELCSALAFAETLAELQGATFNASMWASMMTRSQGAGG